MTRSKSADVASARESAEGRSMRDLVIIAAVGVAVVVVSVFAGIGQALFELLESSMPGGAAGALTVLAVLPVATTLYALRRYRDAVAAGEQLRELSRHDAMTGLPNRRFLTERFETMLRNARRVNGRIGVLFIDLDGFKRINDTFGHDTGDQVMVVVAGRLRDALGPEDIIVRYGGDEFVVLAPEVSGPTTVERLARTLIGVVEKPVELEGEALELSASIGIALTEPHCSRPDDVLRDADAAMYRAKAHGPGRYAMFDRARKDRLTPSTAERRLRQAIAEGEFRLYYQPMVSLWTKRLVGVEALLRWKDGEGSLATPREFLPALEDTGLIVPIGNWVLEEVCRQSREWQDTYPDRPPINIKVNISGRQLAQADFCQRIAESLHSSGADPERLCIEIAEGAIATDMSAAYSSLREAKSLGVSLALDDFGTGYSSLASLRHLSVDLLAIDKSFVDGIGVSREDTTIVEHVVGMAKALGIVTVAEGVESEVQVEHLRAINCDLAQGYYFSRPQPPDVISTLLEESGNRQEWRPPRSQDDGRDDSAPAIPADRFGGAATR